MMSGVQYTHRVRPCEAVVQAELYHALKAVGFLVDLEFSTPGYGRWDVIIHEFGEVVMAFEVKDTTGVQKNGKPTGIGWENTRQGRCYRASGIPYRLVRGMDGIEPAVAWALHVTRRGKSA